MTYLFSIVKQIISLYVMKTTDFSLTLMKMLKFSGNVECCEMFNYLEYLWLETDCSQFLLQTSFDYD